MALLSAGEAAPGAPVTTVAVDLSGLGRGEFDRLDGLGLETRATIRLVQEGFAVVSLRSTPSIVLRVLGQRDSLQLIASSGDRQAQRRVRHSRAPTAELHLEVSQKLVELAREVWVPPPVPSPAVEVPPRRSAPPKAGVVAPSVHTPTQVLQQPAPAPSPSYRASAGAAALLRDGGVDALGIVSLQSAASGLRPVVLLAVSPSGTSRLGVVEGQLQAGLAVPWWSRANVELSAALLVGVVAHLYRPAATLVSPEGARFDLIASMPLELTWNPAGAFVVSLRVAPGVSTRSRSHLEAEEVLWTRSAWRVETGVGLGWVLR